MFEILRQVIPFIPRLLLPAAILAGSWYAYTVLSVEPEKAKGKQAAQRIIRTKITRLTAGSYSVVVKTHGVVQPHNQVAISAEVAGRVVKINPEFEVGAYFSKGDVLIELNDRDYQTALAIAQARQNVAKSAHRLAESQHRRVKELYDSSAITEVELEEAAATLTQTSGELETIASQIAQAKRDLERTKLRAPFDGRVQQKLVGLGQQVSPGLALGTVFAVDYAEVRLPLARRDLRFLNLPEMNGDKPVEVNLYDAMDDASPDCWTATIVRTEGTLDPNSLELFAIARVDDPFGLHSNRPILRIGQPVLARITGNDLKNVVRIPRGAVRQLDQVYLVDEEELTLTRMTIKPLWSDDQDVIVRESSIQDSALLATSQLVYAPEGSRVEIIPEADGGESLVSAHKRDQ